MNLTYEFYLIPLLSSESSYDWCQVHSLSDSVSTENKSLAFCKCEGGKVVWPGGQERRSRGSSSWLCRFSLGLSVCSATCTPVFRGTCISNYCVFPKFQIRLILLGLLFCSYLLCSSALVTHVYLLSIFQDFVATSPLL